MNLEEFLYPHHHQQGTVAPTLAAFTAELETFAQQVSYTCNLETGGKLSPEHAYARLEQLWQQLTQVKEQLGIGST